MVPVVFYPFRGAVYLYAIKICVWRIPKQCTRAKVNELKVTLQEIYQDVLVLYVPVQYTAQVAMVHRLHHLSEITGSQIFREWAPVCDDIKQVLRHEGAPHNNEVRVRLLKPIQEADDTLATWGGHLLQ